MNTTDVVCHRLKDYKRTSKEPEDVKNTRKLLAGIKLRRDRRENEVLIARDPELVCSICANTYTQNIDRPVRFTRLDNHKRLPRFLTVILFYICFISHDQY